MKLMNKEPLAIEVVGAIRSGDPERLSKLLQEHEGLATAVIETKGISSSGIRSLLHILTDWPADVPNGASMAKVLIEAGADVNARFGGTHSETPLHWAASSNSVEVLDALLDVGAEIDADGAVIGGGTPLDDAVAFGQWDAANRLVERGAAMKLWNAAALGRLEFIQTYFAENGKPTQEEITQAFWLACHGGQRNTAEFLLGHGADIHWVGYDKLTPLDAARRSEADELIRWLESIQ
ncbi:ankyrin repeat domain-containing protein [Paenibacillus sp. LHD-117]|uniref:ankyrin repeat domain-containing protein n=1 Tax=Paenibacillus sp. LHD-117 TaxID=3071412 RepID=UPI0027E048FE|nr:ankyrin repeat domain-containing protein [Paenibacillus sp. LHD-117]MDQ6421897.1 ankyrin repeat domain-containing protein [Paenibacillus sp. LHD-117]